MKLQIRTKGDENQNTKTWPRLRVLHSNIELGTSKSTYRMSRLAIPSAEGIRMIDLEDISYIKADGNYSTIHEIGGQTYLMSKTLRHFENRLSNHGFVRTHQSYLINTAYVDIFYTGDRQEISLSDGSHIPVSRRQAPAIKKYLLTQFNF